MKVWYHFFVNLALGYIFGFNFLYTIIFSIGGVLIDLDHVLTYLFKFKTLKGFTDWANSEADRHNPHFFIFHTFEFIIIFLIFGFWLKNTSFDPFFYISSGFATHFITDILTYVYYYKSEKPWLKYLCLLVNI